MRNTLQKPSAVSESNRVNYHFKHSFVSFVWNYIIIIGSFGTKINSFKWNYDKIYTTHKEREEKQMVSYAKRIRDTREDLDISQKDIARVLHTTQSQYSKYELGKRSLPIEHLIELCILYDVSADYLLGFTNEKKRLTRT